MKSGRSAHVPGLEALTGRSFKGDERGERKVKKELYLAMPPPLQALLQEKVAKA